VISDLAGRQHGVVALTQLVDLGLTVRTVDKRVGGGRLHRVHQGVYAVGHPALTADGRRMAAVLACGLDAVLSHRSAAALWDLRLDERSSIDVTAPNRRGRIPKGIDAHRHGSLRLADRTSLKGIPCTTVARTLLDLAGVVGMRQLEKAISEAEVLRLFDLDTMREVIARSRGRRGIARLRLLVSEFDPRTKLTRSELERRFLALCGRAGLPPPEVNVPLALGRDLIEADFLWRDARLIVEADGRAFHDTASAFERDRRRDQRLMLAGWQVIRCTWRQVVDEPADLARTLRKLLATADRPPMG
jgi:predicted transcriptional regulator of viral defense system